MSAIISAPISALVFGGVTGSGTDLLVAAFQQAGSTSTAVLQQGLLSDPIDKTLTFFIVFALLGALSRRFVARFPQGEAGRRPGGPSRIDASTRAATAALLRTTPRSSRLAPAPRPPYHRLNPLTKAVAATVGSIGAFVLGGYVGPLRSSPGDPAGGRRRRASPAGSSGSRSC